MRSDDRQQAGTAAPARGAPGTSSRTGQRLLELLLRDRVGAGTAVAAVRVLAGLLFVLAGLPKFVAHDVELAEFVRYGLPPSDLLVYLVGALEVSAGSMLLLGIATRLAALGLAANMIGAMATAGIQVGGWFHLGVAPALLVTMIFLLWAGPGRASLDHLLARRLARGTADRSHVPPVDREATP